MIENNDLDNIIEGEENKALIEYSDIVVKMSKSQYSIFELKRKYENRGDINIAPSFQRNSVWKSTQRCELIESILMGIPIPIIYLFENENGIKEVVDGRQRLTTIFDYINNIFKLKDLKILHHINGMFFSELDLFLQGKIEDYQILSYVIQPPTSERVKFDIFDRVNRGGTTLNNQEMRNALYQGQATKLLNNLSKSQDFIDATDGAINGKRMKDQYLILRFLAFYLFQTIKVKDFQIIYKGDIDDFLGKTMVYINKLNNENIESLTKVFNFSMKLCYKNIDSDVFRFDSEYKKAKRPINMALFETLAYFCSQLYTFNPKDIENKKAEIGEAIGEIKIEMDKTDYISQVDNVAKVNKRFDLANFYFQGLFDD